MFAGSHDLAFEFVGVAAPTPTSTGQIESLKCARVHHIKVDTMRLCIADMDSPRAYIVTVDSGLVTGHLPEYPTYFRPTIRLNRLIGFACCPLSVGTFGCLTVFSTAVATDAM